MEQTPTFQCIKDYKLLNAVKTDVVKMSFASMEELDNDEKYLGWRDYFKELSLNEELSLINK